MYHHHHHHHHHHQYQGSYGVAAPAPSAAAPVQQYQYPNNTYGNVDSLNHGAYTGTTEIAGGGAQMISEEQQAPASFIEAEGPINGMTRIAALGPLTVIKTAFGEYSITEVRRNPGYLASKKNLFHTLTHTLTHSHTLPLSRRGSLNQGLMGPFKIV